MDEDIRDALRGYVTTREPPVGLTSTGLIRRGRRSRRLRSMLNLTGAAAAVVALAALVVVVGTGVKPNPDQVAAPASVTVRDREAGRLTTALSQFLAGLRAQASLVANGDVPFFPGGAQRPADIPLRFVDEGAYFYTSADIKDSAGTGSIRVASGLLDTSFRDTRACPGDPSPRDVSLTCETQALSGGGLMMTMNSAIGEAGHNIWVEVLRADGYSVIVQVLNFSAVPLAAGQTQSYRPTTPLTLTQAIALAQEPALATTIH